MTFLELVKALCDECGISSTGPLTVVGQVGEFKRAVDWITRAWNRIEGSRKDWNWLRSTVSFNTVASQAVYPLGSGVGTVGVTQANFRSWVDDSFRQYLTATGFRSEVPLGSFISYSDWQDIYNMGAFRTTNTPPIEIAVGPNNEIVLGGPALAGYTITGDYFRKSPPLVLDTDVPSIPDADKHMIIVYRAMMFYGAFESATEVYQYGETEYKKLRTELEIEYLPRIDFA